MDDYVTTAQAADELGVNPSRVRQLITQGRLRTRKVGRDHLITRAELEEVRQRPAGWPKGRPRSTYLDPRSGMGYHYALGCHLGDPIAFKAFPGEGVVIEKRVTDQSDMIGGLMKLRVRLADGRIVTVDATEAAAPASYVAKCGPAYADWQEAAARRDETHGEDRQRIRALIADLKTTLDSAEQEWRETLKAKA